VTKIFKLALRVSIEAAFIDDYRPDRICHVGFRQKSLGPTARQTVELEAEVQRYLEKSEDIHMKSL
jgi:hypothetical protein